MTATTTSPTHAAPVEEQAAPAVSEAAPVAQAVEQDLLVEDVSIDGMCGVY